MIWDVLSVMVEWLWEGDAADYIWQVVGEVTRVLVEATSNDSLGVWLPVALSVAGSI